jgi:cytochrome c biogenesis protein CcmG/thiol:disulfide interchange protein DsbE
MTWVSQRMVIPEGRLVGTAVLLAVALSIAVTYAAPVQPGQSVPAAARLGSPAPAFALLMLDGAPVQLADLRGRIVLLNFWATWCPPCRAEMPELDALAHERPDVSVLAVDVQEDVAQVERFRTELQLSLPIALDDDGHAWKSYQSRGLPTTYLIDGNGTIRDVQVGPLTLDLLRTKLKRLQ